MTGIAAVRQSGMWGVSIVSDSELLPLVDVTLGDICIVCSVYSIARDVGDNGECTNSDNSFQCQVCLVAANFVSIARES